MISAFTLLQQIMNYNREFESDNNTDKYQQSLKNLFAQLPLLHQSQKDTNQYIRLIEQHQKSWAQKEIFHTYQISQTEQLGDMEHLLSKQVKELYDNAKIYDHADARDKLHQKRSIKNFFLKYKTEFLLVFEKSPEAILKILSSCKIIYLQALFFSSFKSVVAQYLSGLGRQKTYEIIGRYFYHSPVKLKNYFEGSDLLARADYKMGRFDDSKIHVALIADMVDENTVKKALELVAA